MKLQALARLNSVTKLGVVFAVTYLALGLSSQFGIVSQPVQYFMKEGLHMTAGEVSAYLAVLMAPWVFKPFYVFICDCLPLFGYRRKSYVVLFNLLAGAALLVIAASNCLPVILGALVCLAIGMAASNAVTVGLAVELGRSDQNARGHLSLQTFCYYCALIAAALTGGLLCRVLSPLQALHVAALMAAAVAFAAAIIAAVLLKEQKSACSKVQFHQTAKSLRLAFSSRSLWLVVLFIACWDFSPSFGVPLYFFESNSLHFSQSNIGMLAAWNAAGMALGALVFRWLIKRLPLQRQLYLTVFLGCASTLAYLLLSTVPSAIALELFRGTSNSLAILAIYSLAAQVCPVGTEVTVMAILIAVRNLATEGSTYIGGRLFSTVFHNQLAPLVLVAAATTGLCALLVPLFRPPDKSN